MCSSDCTTEGGPELPFNRSTRLSMHSEMRRFSDEYDVGTELSDARITSQLTHLGDQLHKTHSALTELQDRIDMILLPELSDANEVAGMPPRKPSGVLSNQIDELNSVLGDLQQRIIRTAKRVQL